MGYSAKTRCEQVSPRFQEAYDKGTLNYMTNGTWKGQNGKDKPVICAASVLGGDCETLLFTSAPKREAIASERGFPGSGNERRLPQTVRFQC